MRTEPVKYSAGPFRKGCEPLRVMVMVCESWTDAAGAAPDPEAAPAWFAWADAEASRERDMTVVASSFIFVLSNQCLMVVPPFTGVPLQQLVRRNRQFPDASARGVEDGV